VIVLYASGMPKMIVKMKRIKRVFQTQGRLQYYGI